MKLSLVYKLVLFFSVFIFFLIVPLSLYFYIEATEIIEKQTDNYLTAIAESVEGQVFLAFDKTKTRAADWSSDGLIRETTEKIVKNQKQEDMATLSDYFLNKKLPLNHTIKLIDVVSLDGVILASSEKKRVGLVEDEHVLPEEREKLANAKFGETFISELEEESKEEAEEMYHPLGLMYHSMVPIKSIQTGETVGILLLHFSGEIFDQLMSGIWQVEQGAKTGQEFTKRLNTSEIYLVNKDGLMITPSRFIENAVLKQKADTLPVKNCLEKNEEFVGEYLNYLGTKVRGSSMCFSTFGDHNMTLIVEVAEDELFADLIKERTDFILLTLLLWILGILFSILFGRFFLKNIKIIHNTAIRVAKGDFKIRAVVKARDESGDLATIFNQMLDNIEESREDLARSNQDLQNTYKELERINASLEEKVKIRTNELENIKANLELRVHEKTMELQERLNELEKFRKLTIGRELKMIELKDEIDNLKRKIGEIESRS